MQNTICIQIVDLYTRILLSVITQNGRVRSRLILFILTQSRI